MKDTTNTQDAYATRTIAPTLIPVINFVFVRVASLFLLPILGWIGIPAAVYNAMPFRSTFGGPHRYCGRFFQKL